MTVGRNAPTAAQLAFVETLQRRFHLPDPALDGHCVRRFGTPFADLDRREASALLEEMLGWRDLPAELVKAKGQLELFGMDS